MPIELQESPLLNLPEEVLLVILSYLSSTDLISVQLTSQLLFRLSNDESIWRFKLSQYNWPLAEKKSIKESFFTDKKAFDKKLPADKRILFQAVIEQDTATFLKQTISFEDMQLKIDSRTLTSFLTSNTNQVMKDYAYQQLSSNLDETLQQISLQASKGAIQKNNLSDNYTKLKYYAIALLQPWQEIQTIFGNTLFDPCGLNETFELGPCWAAMHGHEAYLAQIAIINPGFLDEAFGAAPLPALGIAMLQSNFKMANTIITYLTNAGLTPKPHNNFGICYSMPSSDSPNNTSFLETLRKLLQAGFDRGYVPTNLGENLLHKAINKGNLAAVKLLTEESFPTENNHTRHKLTYIQSVYEGMTPVFRAALRGHEKIASYLLEYEQRLTNDLIDQNEHEGKREEISCSLNITCLYEGKILTPLHIAIVKRQDAMVDVLLAERARWWQPSRDNGKRAIHYAAEYNNVHAMQAIFALDIEENVNAVDFSNITPLMYAARKKNREAFDLLLSHNADVNVADNNDDHALTYACLNSDLDMAEKLILAGAYETPGMRTVLVNNRPIFLMLPKLEIIKRIVEHNPNVLNARNSDNETPLIVAIKRGDAELVAYFLSQNANLTVTVNYKTPLQYATNNPSIFMQVLKKQMDVTAALEVIRQKNQAGIEYIEQTKPELFKSLTVSNLIALKGDVIAYLHLFDEDVVKQLWTRLTETRLLSTEQIKKFLETKPELIQLPLSVDHIRQAALSHDTNFAIFLIEKGAPLTEQAFYTAWTRQERKIMNFMLAAKPALAQPTSINFNPLAMTIRDEGSFSDINILFNSLPDNSAGDALKTEALTDALNSNQEDRALHLMRLGTKPDITIPLNNYGALSHELTVRLMLLLYIEKRNNEPKEYSTSFTFFGKDVNFGYSKKAKLHAAAALHNVLFFNEPLSTLEEHREALGNGKLGKIFQLCDLSIDTLHPLQ